MLFIHEIIREAAARRGRVTSTSKEGGKIDATSDFTETWDTFNRYITAHFLKLRGVNLNIFLKIGWVADGNSVKPYFALSDSFASQFAIEHSLARPPQSDLCKFSDLNWVKASMKFSRDANRDVFRQCLTDIINLIGEHARQGQQLTIDFEVGRLYIQDRRARFSFSSRVLQATGVADLVKERGGSLNCSASVVSGMTNASQTRGLGGMVYNPSASFQVEDDAVSSLSGLSRATAASKANFFSRKNTQSGTNLFAQGGVAHPVYNNGADGPLLQRDRAPSEVGSSLTEANLERLNRQYDEASKLNALQKTNEHADSMARFLEQQRLNGNLAGHTTKSILAGSSPVKKPATAAGDAPLDLNAWERESPFLVNEIRRLRAEANAANIASSEVKERLQMLAGAAEELLRKKQKTANTSMHSIGLEPKRDVLSNQPDAALLGYLEGKATTAFAGMGQSTAIGQWTSTKSAAEEALDRYLTYLEVRAAQALRERELYERGVQRSLEEEREEAAMKSAMTQQYREYLESQIKYDKEMKERQRQEDIAAASSHEFPMMSESAPDVLRREMHERQTRLRDDLLRQVELSKALKERERVTSQLQEAQVQALAQAEVGNKNRLELMQKQQEKIELISAWERDLRMKNLLKSIESHISKPQLVPVDLGDSAVHVTLPSNLTAAYGNGSLHNPLSPAEAQALTEKHEQNYALWKQQTQQQQQAPHSAPQSPQYAREDQSGTYAALAAVEQQRATALRQSNLSPSQVLRRGGDIFEARPASSGGSLFRSASAAILNGGSKGVELPPVANASGNGQREGSVLSFGGSQVGGGRTLPGGAAMSLEKRRALLAKSKSVKGL